MGAALIEYTTLGGVRLHLTPISVPVRAGIVRKSEDVFPYPDAAPYRHQMKNAADGVLTNPLDDPEFARLVTEVDRARQRWQFYAFIRTATTLPDYTPELLVARFSALIESVRPYVDLSDYEIALFQGVLNWDEDWNAVLLLVIQQQKLPLSASEVADGIRLFRYSLQERTA